MGIYALEAETGLGENRTHENITSGREMSMGKVPLAIVYSTIDVDGSIQSSSTTVLNRTLNEPSDLVK